MSLVEKVREVERDGGSISFFFVASHCRTGKELVEKLYWEVGLGYGAIAHECKSALEATMNALCPGRYPALFAEAFEIAKRNKPAPRECAATGGA